MLPTPWYTWLATHPRTAVDPPAPSDPPLRGYIVALLGGPLLLWLLLIVALALDARPPRVGAATPRPATWRSTSRPVAIAPGTPLGGGCDTQPRGPTRPRPWSPFTAARLQQPRDHAVCARSSGRERPTDL